VNLTYQLLFVLINAIVLVLVYYLMKCIYGKTNTMLFLSLAIIFGVVAESIGLAGKTYFYGDLFGIPLGGMEVPFVIAFAWAWVLGVSMVIADRISKGSLLHFFWTPVIAIIWDFLVIEPVAMHTGMWSWNNPVMQGWIAPVSNYIGWGLVALFTTAFWTIFLNNDTRKEIESVHIGSCYGKNKKAKCRGKGGKWDSKEEVCRRRRR